MLDRRTAFVRRWLDDRDRYDAAWHDRCAVSAETWLRVSPDEARQLADELTQLLDRWSTRLIPDDGQPRESVLVFAHTVPASP